MILILHEFVCIEVQFTNCFLLLCYLLSDWRCSGCPAKGSTPWLRYHHAPAAGRDKGNVGAEWGSTPLSGGGKFYTLQAVYHWCYHIFSNYHRFRSDKNSGNIKIKLIRIFQFKFELFSFCNHTWPIFSCVSVHKGYFGRQYGTPGRPARAAECE